MTPEVKERIEQIRHGIVPEGYKKTATGISPNSWNEVRLSEVVDFLDDRRIPIKENDRVSGNYPYYGASGIIDHVADYIFDGEYILLGEDGANILERSTPLAFRVSGKCWINNHAHVLSPKAEYHIDYLTNYLESLSYVKYNSGTAQPKLNQDTCQKIPVVCGSYAEQAQTADILTTQDTVIHLKEKLLSEKQRQKKYLMQQLLSGKKRLLGYNQKWTKTRLGAISSMSSGGTPLSQISDYYGDRYVWVSISDMSASGKYIVSSEKKLTQKGFDNCSAKLYPIGTILFAMYASIGACAISNVECCSSQAILGIEVSEQVLNEFLYYFLLNGRDEFKKLSQASSQPNLNKKIVESIAINLPPLDEQERIVDILSKMDQNCDLLIRDIEQEKQKKKALMQLLLTGIVRVNA